MRNTVNKTHIEGYLYSHSLEKKKSGPNSKTPGVEYISGEVQVATDDAMLNIVPVHFTYVTATGKNGNPNQTFAALNAIVSGTHKAQMASDRLPNEVPARVRIDSAIGLNDFYTVSRTTNEVELVSAKRNEGGFVHILNATDKLSEDEKLRNTFEVDMIITNVIRREANEERDIPESVLIKGAVFDFRQALLPVEFTAKNTLAMDYFEGLGASPKEPVFTRLKGRQISEDIVQKVVEQGAFGEPSVKEVQRKNKEFLVTWAAGETYPWDEEGSILATELTEAMNNRNVYLATLKQRYDEYQASKTTVATPAAVTPTAGAFNF